jgi:hypothetical protein
MLFQSGYGSNSDSHRFFCEKVAAEGFIVIAADRTDDLRCGCCAVVGFLNLLSCAALSVDGSHLLAAAAYAKNTKNRWMDRADPTKLIVSGACVSVFSLLRGNVPDLMFKGNIIGNCATLCFLLPMACS